MPPPIDLGTENRAMASPWAALSRIFFTIFSDACASRLRGVAKPRSRVRRGRDARAAGRVEGRVRSKALDPAGLKPRAGDAASHTRPRGNDFAGASTR